MSNHIHDDFSPVDVVEVYHKSKMLAVDKMEVDTILATLKDLGRVVDGKKSGVLLDVGCGFGVATSLLAKYFDRTIAVDPSPGQILKANEIGHPNNIEFKIAPAENLPVADGTIDVITVIVAIHFIAIKKFVKECRRVLKPGGVAVFFTRFPSALIPIADDNLPPIVDEIKELKRVSAQVATATSHPERHVLDNIEAQYSAIKWPGKRKVNLTTEIETTLSAIRRYYRSVPFYSKIGTAPGDELMKVFDAARTAWKMDLDAAIRVTFDASMIILE